MYIGNASDKDDEYFGRELWLTNADARTHILYLGTTGSGKTEGLKALVTNALAWGSGFVYIDGKADTDLWASLYALARRFGRDDDMLVLNYMTGNSDDGSVSNTMNPFSNGSSSYLANMITSFMPDAGGDNAMWKERAVALMFALDAGADLQARPAGLAARYRRGARSYRIAADHPPCRATNACRNASRTACNGYLHTLPGFVDAAFDDEGNERPPSPDQPMYDLQVARQQHGYLSMQFTRSLQMLADEYGYIFKAQLADVDVLDVVLNRRILVVLIPALEKSGDEAANLGKIVAASLKGMMGATLGNTVEGSWESAIGSKQTRSTSSFMTVFDEVGYYTAQGMAVMAAQARSLGFSLVFAVAGFAVDGKARQAGSANPSPATATSKFSAASKIRPTPRNSSTSTAAPSWVMETNGMTAPTNTISSMFMSHAVLRRSRRCTVQGPPNASITTICATSAKARRICCSPIGYVQRAHVLRRAGKSESLARASLPAGAGHDLASANRERIMQEMAAHLKDPEWSATGAGAAVAAAPEIEVIAKGFANATASRRDPVEAGILSLAGIGGLPPPKPQPADASGDNVPRAASGASPGRAPAVATRDGTTPKGPPVHISDIPDGEARERRAGLPPLQEGDQYAIEAVERAPAATGGATTVAIPAGVQVSTTGFVGTDADLAIVTHPHIAENEPGVTDVQLAPEIAALLEQSAKKLSRGLAGSEGRAQ